VSEYGHTWNRSSLIARALEPPEPPTIGGLLYPAKRTLLSGETESLKTWAALILAKAEMDAGHPVAWADLDAMGAAELLSRLRALEVEDAVVDELFLYYEPAERLIGDVLEEVCGEIAERAVRLFVIDAFNPILNLHGLDPGSTSDVETFWREVATPITEAGAAPTLLDHVVKNADNRGKYAYGSERKASGAIVHVGFRILEQFTRGGTGRTLLSTHKDRPGFLPRPTIGRLVLVSDAEVVSYSLEADRSHDADTFRPTVLMERVSRKLEAEFEPRSQRWIEENVTGKGDALRQALGVLVDEGFIVRDELPKGYRFTSVRPFREADDEPPEVSGATASPPRPHRVPDLRSNPSTDRVPESPHGDAGRGGVDKDALLRPHRVPDSAAAGVECPRHGNSRHWRSKVGEVRCAECVPPITEAAVAEWIEVA
jgi:AAA domain-containing protein